MTGEVEERKSMRGDDEGHVIFVSDVRWHDRHEEEPGYEGRYLVALRRGGLRIAGYEDGKWYAGGKHISHDVEYWADLPESPGW